MFGGNLNVQEAVNCIEVSFVFVVVVVDNLSI